MSAHPPPGPGNFGRRFEDAIDRFEEELRNAVRYMNNRVVPQVRRESIGAMRRVAETLGNLADRMEHGTEHGTPPQARAAKPEDRRP